MPPTAMWTIDPHTDLHTNTLMILCKTWFCVSPIHTTLILECVVVSEIQTTVRPVIIVLVLMWVILRRIVWEMMIKIPSLIDWLMLHCGAISGAISGGLGWILTSLNGANKKTNLSSIRSTSALSCSKEPNAALRLFCRPVVWSLLSSCR